eukprot:TRINITY_DN474_c1_g1_i1.p1 TRINITY_DN474_c1_g1~~TRINITY_DN474_c1_g1_i1.p1  ORF type:complete len:362 (-),score=26.31 TRINITY_DN474_c1_g1_i1:293-1378(-)
MMKYRTLGNSSLKVSELCLGTMTWGVQNTEEEAWEQLDYALSQGINFIDTAESYPVPPSEKVVGRTEEYIGRWITARGNRDKIILATKVISRSNRNYVAANRSVPKAENAHNPVLDEKNIREAIEGSLRRLQTTYIDLYQLHWPDRYVPIFGRSQYRLRSEHDSVPFEEQLRTLADLIKEGKVRYWGVSNETAFGLTKFCMLAERYGLPLPVSIQNDFSLTNRNFERELAEVCSPRHYNVGLLAYGALAGGTLSGKYLDGALPPKSRHTLYPDFQTRYHSPQVLEATRKYVELAKSMNITPTQLALAWCRSRWYMGSIILGATTLDQLKECISCIEVELDVDTLKKIDRIHLECQNPNLMD